ncbi:MAG: hypothetical protein C0401_09980 [Anaerolinea sp.]|nr:hypothetical protein [Anaerolinea sp.]
MRYTDRIYGSVEIDNLVLLALLDSKAVKRIQGVLQHGISGLVGITRPTSRFEHSVGVMLLVRLYGGSLEEQIAALLHDVSHTALSHVIDFVFDSNNSQNYHERVKAQYMGSTDLPAILDQYGYDWHDFIDEERYLLLEQPLPDLCADRLDYFLRDSIDLKLATSAEATLFLQHLKVHEGQFVVDNLDTARWLAYKYMAADEMSWANPREVGLSEFTARAIRLAVQSGVITEDDFWGTDQQLWQKLCAANNPELKEQLRFASSETQFVLDDSAPTFLVSTKLRAVDPKVLNDVRATALSTLDLDFAAYRSHYLTSNQGKRPIRIIPHPEG